jgi:hypothetical protein
VGDILATQELAEQAVPRFRVKVRLYWQLIKSLQTGLLLITGIAGFMSVCCPV